MNDRGLPGCRRWVSLSTRDVLDSPDLNWRCEGTGIGQRQVVRAEEFAPLFVNGASVADEVKNKGSTEGEGGLASRRMVKALAAPFWGLRAKLLIGLAVVSLALVVSVGFVSLWAVEHSLHLKQRKQAHTLAYGATRVLEAALERGSYDLSQPRVRSALERVFSKLSRHEGFVQIALMDSKGTVLQLGDGRGSLPPKKDSRFELVRRASELSLHRRERRSGHPRGEGVDFVFYRQVRARRRWVVMRLVYSADAAVEGLMVRAKTAVWLLALIDGVLLLVLAGVILTRSVINPIRRMETAARRVAQGELDTVVEEKGTGELQHLAVAFNEMTRRLQDNQQVMDRHIRQLQDSSRALEDKQAELDASWEHLMRAEKFASVGRLAAGVAHEVGNPLTAVVGYVEMLRDEALSEDERKQFVGLMERELERVDSTIRGLLDYSRRDRGPLLPRDPMEAVRHAARLVKSQKRMRRVDIRVMLEEDLPSIMISENALDSVLVNLFLNAADAMEGEGEIVVYGAEHAAKKDSEDLEVFVSDSGPGVPEELREKVFDPFFTTKEVGEGTGLGLAISQSLVETMGGRLELAPSEEQHGGGACFRLVLKTSKEKASGQGNSDEGSGE